MLTEDHLDAFPSVESDESVDNVLYLLQLALHDGESQVLLRGPLLAARVDRDLP